MLVTLQGLRKRNLRRQRGQGMTEYVIIVALVAVLSIGVVTIFGDNVRALFGASANALAGQKNQANMHHNQVTETDVQHKIDDVYTNKGIP